MIFAMLLAAGTDLMPLEEGNAWRFQGTVHTGEQDTEVEFAVEVEAGEDGAFGLNGSFVGVWGFGEFFQMMMPQDPAQGGEEIVVTDTVTVTDGGVRITGFTIPMEESPDLGEGWLWIDAQVEEGHEWESDTPMDPQGGDVMHCTYSWGAVEEVTVPAGTFQARRLEFSIMVDAEGVAGTMWLAPGTGPVRVHWRFAEGPRDEFRMEADLQRFETTEEEG